MANSDNVIVGAAISWVIFWTITVFVMIAGWITNLIWIFQSADLEAKMTETVLAIVGVVIPIIGGVHGVLLWF